MKSIMNKIKKDCRCCSIRRGSS